jgi:hypothetical protein
MPAMASFWQSPMKTDPTSVKKYRLSHQSTKIAIIPPLFPLGIELDNYFHRRL